jgi:hypothetical protein
MEFVNPPHIYKDVSSIPVFEMITLLSFRLAFLIRASVENPKIIASNLMID